MPKRFTDNNIWKKGWFMKLPAHIKLFWQYLRDDCDAAGVWEPNFDVASLFVGQQVTEKDLEYFGDRIEKIDNGKYWLTTFIEFQYNNNLSEKSPAHKPIFSSINKNKIHNRVFNRLSYRVSDTLQEKDKEKDKEECITVDENLIAPRMLKAFTSKNTSYPPENIKDLTACLEMAYKIGEGLKISKHDVTGKSKDQVLSEWEKIVAFVMSDSWYRNRSLSDLSKEWQRLMLAKSNKQTPIEQQHSNLLGGRKIFNA